MITYKRSLSISDLLKPTGKFLTAPFLPTCRSFSSSAVRLGMMDILRSLGFSRGIRVLVPPVCPQGLILPLKRTEIEIDFYHLKGFFEIDLECIEDQIKTRHYSAVFFIHYFGIFNPQIYALKKLCRQYKILVFEDCVHGLFSPDDEDRPMGTAGDISFFSLPKSLPVADGAFFYINNPSLCIEFRYHNSQKIRIGRLCNLLSLMINAYYSKSRIKINSLFLKGLSVLFYGVYYVLLCSQRRNVDISGQTLEVLSTIDIDGYIYRKKQMYELYRTNIGMGEYSTCESVSQPVATGYPLINTAKDMKRLKFRLLRQGVEALSYTKAWNHIPETAAFDYERKLLRGHLLLPLDEKLLSHSENELQIFFSGINNLLN